MKRIWHTGFFMEQFSKHWKGLLCVWQQPVVFNGFGFSEARFFFFHQLLSLLYERENCAPTKYWGQWGFYWNHSPLVFKLLWTEYIPSTIPKLSPLPPHSHQKMVQNYCSFIFGEYLGYNFEFFLFTQQLFIQHLLCARLWGYKDE